MAASELDKVVWFRPQAAAVRPRQPVMHGFVETARLLPDDRSEYMAAGKIVYMSLCGGVVVHEDKERQSESALFVQPICAACRDIRSKQLSARRRASGAVESQRRKR